LKLNIGWVIGIDTCNL